MENDRMRGWGITLLILGVGSFIMPFVGLQFRALALFGTLAPIIGGIVAIIGSALIVISLRHNVGAAIAAAVGLLIFLVIAPCLISVAGVGLLKGGAFERLLPVAWRTYRAPDGSFTVELPGTPAVKDVFQSGIGIKAVYYEHPTLGDFAVVYGDLPSHLVAPQREHLLQAASAFAGQSLGPGPRRSQVLQLGPHPGLELAVGGTTSGAQKWAYQQCYIVDRRVYSLVWVGVADEPPAALSRFLGSFTLSGQPYRLPSPSVALFERDDSSSVASTANASSGNNESRSTPLEPPLERARKVSRELLDANSTLLVTLRQIRDTDSAKAQADSVQSHSLSRNSPETSLEILRQQLDEADLKTLDGECLARFEKQVKLIEQELARVKRIAQTGQPEDPAPLSSEDGRAITQGPLIGGSGGDPFTLAGDGRQPMLGVRYELQTYRTEQCVARLEPLYEAQAATSGVVMAREGYAVGGIRVDAGNHVRAVQLIFMRLKENRLDPSDSYTGPWIGFASAGEPQEFRSSGPPVVGLCGRRGIVVDAVGLLFE